MKTRVNVSKCYYRFLAVFFFKFKLFIFRTCAPDSSFRKVPGKIPRVLGKSSSTADIRAFPNGRKRIQTTKRRNRTADWPYQWTLFYAQLVANSIHLWMFEPRTIGGVVQGLRGGFGHSTQGRNEPGGQRVRGVSDPDAGRIDTVAVRRRRRDHARGVVGEPVRTGRDGQRAEPGPENAAGRARTAHDTVAAPGTVAGRQLLDDVIFLVNERAKGRR